MLKCFDIALGVPEGPSHWSNGPAQRAHGPTRIGRGSSRQRTGMASHFWSGGWAVVILAGIRAISC